MTKYELARLRYIAADRRLIEQLLSVANGSQPSGFRCAVKELAVARRALGKVKKTKKLSLEYFWAFTTI